MNTKELRDMTPEDLQQIFDDTCRRLFELRVQAQAERLDAPSELARNRKLIARIKTVQREQQQDSETAVAVDEE